MYALCQHIWLCHHHLPTELWVTCVHHLLFPRIRPLLLSFCSLYPLNSSHLGPHLPRPQSFVPSVPLSGTAHAHTSPCHLNPTSGLSLASLLQRPPPQPLDCHTSTSLWLIFISDAYHYVMFSLFIIYVPGLGQNLCLSKNWSRLRTRSPVSNITSGIDA